ncbi:MAG: DUF853 family protein [Eubacterium sp.]|nr:DUF853 family protein [Eubacterium sp.]
MYQDGRIWIAKSGDEKITILPKMANRHGLIAGATGTGKTITLKVLAESFSDCGVPVFLADAKGDLAGMCRPGQMDENLQKRIEKFGLAEEGFSFHSYPTNFWDVYEQNGLPLRTTISEMGPLLMSQIMGLNATQTGIMNIIYKIADDENLLLIDTKDLRSMIQYVGDHCSDYTLKYGNITKQSLGAISRSLVTLESQGGDKFFGEPALNVRDWISRDTDGRGVIQVLDCQELMHNPTMYATFMLWMMSELFETLPEVGDADKPKMIFFFDEAHMLFDNASKELLTKIEQVVKLIRSKGVGIYFITQSPSDIPDGVLGQLGNKIQHALHAYTPADQKAARAAAQSYRVNEEFDTYDALVNLGIGEALISVLDEDGIPTVVKKSKILPPQSLMGSIDDSVRDQAINQSFLYSAYKEGFDRDSAYEFLMRKQLEDEAIAAREAEEQAAAKAAAKAAADAEKAAAKQKADAEKAALREEEAKKRKVKTAVSSTAKTAAGTIGREVGNTVGKTFGGTLGRRLGGNIGASLGRGIIGTLFKL